MRCHEMFQPLLNVTINQKNLQDILKPKGMTMGIQMNKYVLRSQKKPQSPLKRQKQNKKLLETFLKWRKILKIFRWCLSYMWRNIWTPVDYKLIRFSVSLFNAHKKLIKHIEISNDSEVQKLKVAHLQQARGSAVQLAVGHLHVHHVVPVNLPL